jgi:CheY-like chemotaxis protein
MPEAAPQQLRGRRILVAEDEPPVREALSKLLEDAGANVVLASNGDEAIASASAQDFAIILMDIRMPIVDGLTATARLREAGLRTPILALTASALAEQREACLLAGCDDVIAKPVSAAALTARLVAALPDGAVR